MAFMAFLSDSFPVLVFWGALLLPGILFTASVMIAIGSFLPCRQPSHIWWHIRFGFWVVWVFCYQLCFLYYTTIRTKTDVTMVALMEQKFQAKEKQRQEQQLKDEREVYRKDPKAERFLQIVAFMDKMHREELIAFRDSKLKELEEIRARKRKLKEEEERRRSQDFRNAAAASVEDAVRKAPKLDGQEEESSCNNNGKAKAKKCRKKAKGAW